MKRLFQVFGQILSVLLLPVLSFSATGSYDWEAEEGGAGVEREIQLTRNRSYAGGADEQDLKVQKYLAPTSRSPEAAAELVKREGAEVDDHSVND